MHIDTAVRHSLYHRTVMLLFTSLLAILLSACGGNVNKAPQIDYEAALSDLPQVQKIFGFRLDNWEYINDQTLFVDTDPSRHYLLVLRRPHPHLDNAFNLRVSSSDRDVYAGTSRITDGTSPETFIIDSIYEIDANQRDEIRARILSLDQQS